MFHNPWFRKKTYLQVILQPSLKAGLLRYMALLLLLLLPNVAACCESTIALIAGSLAVL